MQVVKEGITLEGKAKDFVDFLKYGTFNGILEDIGFKVKNGTIEIVSSDDAASGGNFMHVGRYTGFKVTGEGTVGIEGRDNLKYISRLFKSDDEIKMVIDSTEIKVIGPKDEITTPRLEVKDLATYIDACPYVLSEDFMIRYSQGKVKPKTVVKMNASILSEVTKKADIIGQDYFPMSFNEDGVLNYSVGSNTKERTNHVISSTIEGLEHDGDKLEICLQAGFPELVGFLTGNITLAGISNYPVWIKAEKDNALLGFVISPRIEDEDLDEPEPEEQE